MPHIVKGYKVIGYVDIDGVRHDLVQVNRAVWVVETEHDRSIDRCRDREALLRKYPHAQFEDGSEK